MLRFQTPAVLISLIERGPAEFETLKVAEPQRPLRSDRFLQDDMSLKSEINLTDAEMRDE